MEIAKIQCLSLNKHHLFINPIMEV